VGFFHDILDDELPIIAFKVDHIRFNQM